MLRAGGLKILTDALKSAKINITAIQETRWPGKNVISNREYAFYYSGIDNKQGTFGTGFVVLKEAMNAVIDFKPIDERLCTLRIKGKFFNITIINGHAPTEDKDDDVKDVFYENLQKAYNNSPARDIKIVLGDFNAKVGQETVYRQTVGINALHNTTNENGTRLVDFAVTNNMVVASTYFPHKDIHKITWVSPDGHTRNQIDHVLIDARHKSNVMDVRSCRGLNIDSDHYLVRMICRARIHAQSAQHPATRRYDLTKLKSANVKKQYEETMEQHIIARLERPQPESVNETWGAIVHDIESVAEEVIGFQNTRRRNNWFDEECEAILAAKNTARNKYLQRATRANKDDYREKRNTERKLFRKKKVQKERELFEEIQILSSNNDTRGLYGKVKQNRAGYTQQPLFCKDTNGTVIANEERCIVRWTEYFRELLNNNNAENRVANQQAVRVNDQMQPHPYIAEPSLEEVKATIMKLKNNKAPGSDNIPAELIKHGGIALSVELHQLITQIWRNEELPEEWKMGVICPLHKKGDKLECGNYRGITLLNIAYKLFANVLYQRLLPYAEENIGEYQCGFRRDRSTTDQIFSVRQILEKCREFNVDTHHLFVDFKAAYDSVIRLELWNTMIEFGFPHKLISLTKLTLHNVTSCVRIRNRLSESFTTADGLRQGDPLASLLFNIVLEKAVRSSNVNVHNTIYRKSVQLVAYADDIDIVARSVRHLEEPFTALRMEAANLGLEVNVDKTKYMVATASTPLSTAPQTIQLGETSFNMIDNFVYLGSLVNSMNIIGEEVRRRVTIGNRCYFSLKKLFLSTTLSRKLKCTLYSTLVRPVVMYGSETWVMTQKDENYLRTFERKILRTIFGAVFDCGIWRRRFNHELEILYNEPDIVRLIKIGRLRWFGHVQRMPSYRIPLKLFEGWPDGRRRAGRPRGRWKDAVFADLKAMRIHDWKTLAGNRPDWRRMLQEAKTDKRL